MIPEAPGGRFAVYLGTGGPGHIDPHHNDGVTEGSQGIQRGPVLGAARSSRCSTRIRAQRRGGAARGVPQLRRDVPLVGRRAAGAALGGEGRQERGHPRERAHRRRPHATPGSRSSRTSCPTTGGCASSTTGCSTSSPSRPCPRGADCRIGYETRGRRRARRGEALTMIEFARDAGGRHAARLRGQPPSRDRGPLAADADPRARSGSAARSTEEWFEDRARVLTETYPDDATRPAPAPHLGLHAAGARCATTSTGRCGGARRRWAIPSTCTRTWCQAGSARARRGRWRTLTASAAPCARWLYP